MVVTLLETIPGFLSSLILDADMAVGDIPNDRVVPRFFGGKTGGRRKFWGHALVGGATGPGKMSKLPPSPAVRTWTLSPLEVKELLPAEVGKEAKLRRKGRKKKD